MVQSNLDPARSFDRLNAVFAGITALIAFIIYRLTVAPTLSYWDCGEFIACAHILGNPHPPGTPLFILIGRFFDLLPIGSDPAFRINMMSVVSSTFSALFAYLIGVRLISSWYDPTSPDYKLGRIIAYAGGFMGALFVAFSRANWTNSVETEPRSMAIVLMLAVFWLGLKFFDHRYDATGKRIVLLASFLSMLAVGVHLTVFLVVPIVALFFSLKPSVTKTDVAIFAGFFAVAMALIFVLAGSHDNYKIFLGLMGILAAALAFFYRNKIYWPILISFIAMSAIMVGFYPFMFAVIGWMVITLVVFFIQRTGLWRMATFIMVAAIIGFSVHLYIPIRSAQHPSIDENSPSRSFRTFVDFLDRKQYGSMSMTERMFERRGSWANQFGDHDRMGFYRILKSQYIHPNVFPALFILGLFGAGFMAWRNPKFGYLFIAFLLIASVGLVLYMNFADGTKFNPQTGDAYQEVRNRYYFFTPAFVLFGMALGMGVAGIAELLRRAVSQAGEGAQKAVVYALVVIMVLAPIVPAQANYFYNDRTGNRMAFNYAYNLLNSCAPNALLFTAGDNDTFPLWCVQEVYGIRKDVRVVNFSLLNTDWYVWQLKHFHNVPISLSDDQILWEPYEINGQVINKPEEPFVDRTRGRKTFLVPMAHEGKLVKVAAMMLDDIILTNKWEYPIYFSSASGEVRESPLRLLDRCYREGLVLQLTRDSAMVQWREDVTDSLFFDVYKYDNLSDTMISQYENSTGIALSLPEKMLDYHRSLLTDGKKPKADSTMERIADAIPSYWRTRITQRNQFLTEGDSAAAEAVTDTMFNYLYGFYHKNPDNIFFPQFLGMAYYTIGELDSAKYFLEHAWAMNRDKEHLFRALLTLYAEERNAAEMLRISQDYLEYQESNQIARDVVRSVQAYMQAPPEMPTNVQPPPSTGEQVPGIQTEPVPVEPSGDGQ